MRNNILNSLEKKDICVGIIHFYYEFLRICICIFYIGIDLCINDERVC